MPDTCKKLVGTGVIQYPCILPEHEGPCVAREIPASKVRREQWLRENIAAGTVETPTPAPEVVYRPDQVQQPEATPEAASPEMETSSTTTPSPQFNPSQHRIDLAQSSLRQPYDQLPTAIKSWVLGATAQLALIDLWKRWVALREAGQDEPGLVLTAEDIEALVPDALRGR